MSNSQVYAMVEDALDNHALDCRCRICQAFVDAENGSKGHAAACNAALDILYPQKEQS